MLIYSINFVLKCLRDYEINREIGLLTNHHIIIILCYLRKNHYICSEWWHKGCRLEMLWVTNIRFHTSMLASEPSLSDLGFRCRVLLNTSITLRVFIFSWSSTRLSTCSLSKMPLTILLFVARIMEEHCDEALSRHKCRF